MYSVCFIFHHLFNMAISIMGMISKILMNRTSIYLFKSPFFCNQGVKIWAFAHVSLTFMIIALNTVHKMWELHVCPDITSTIENTIESPIWTSECPFECVLTNIKLCYIFSDSRSVT